MTTLRRSDCPSRLTLDRYVCGELAGAEREGVDQHLAGCQRCAAFVAEQREPAPAADKALIVEAIIDRHRASPPDDTAQERRGGRLLRLSRRLRLPLSVSALAAAACIAWLVMSPRLGSGVPLPPYELEMSRGDQVMMGTLGEGRAEEIPTFARGSRLEMTLRPAQRVEGDVAALLYLEQDGLLRPLPAHFEIAPGGSVRLDAVMGRELALGSGTWDLCVIVYRGNDFHPGAGPIPVAALARAQEHEQVVIKRTRIRLSTD